MLPERVFCVVAFDWDGTAVTDRKTQSAELLSTLEQTLQHGTTCAIITGTKAENVLNQGIKSLSAKAKQKLYLCTNRGSEVFSFDDKGALRLIYRRKASAAEEQSLDKAAVGFQNYARERGLDTQIIADRLNRRKIDLIPTARWADPKKSEFRELFNDVQKRLGTLGIKSGIAELMTKARELTHTAGLPSPNITSDIKHIEIGLTDKADSIRWIDQNIIRPQKISHEKVVFWGDEFGSIGGIEGSDALMRTSELSDAVFASVGVEPEGTPEWVHHVGGGPKRFVEFLKNQIALHELQPETDPSWLLEQEGFDPSREREMETLFAIGNGYLGVRGTSDFPIPAAQPDLIIAGIYDRKAPSLPYSEPNFLSKIGRESSETEIVPFPSPIGFQIEVDRIPLSAQSPKMLTASRKLDLKKGLYIESHRFEDKEGRRTRIETSRFASMSDRHLLVQHIDITSENYSGNIKLSLFLDRDGFEQLYPHLITIQNESTETSPLLTYQTRISAITIAIATKTKLNGADFSNIEPIKLGPGQTIRITRYFSIFTSRDTPNPAVDAVNHVERHSRVPLDITHRDHMQRWLYFWEKADLKINDRPELTQAMRFNLYHLRSTANDDPTVSVPAKGLTGRAYEGHVFWDAEIFMLPFYLHTEPEIAKSQLIYRYRLLPGAKRRATQMGYQGASFAWESTLSGEDVTPKSITITGTNIEVPIFTGEQQIHVTADIAYGIWRYWNATLDHDFMLNYGAEILIETARFWMSRVSWRDQTYHISNVVGPDEYHHSVEDNAFTNWMVRFNLQKATWATEWIRDHYPIFYTKLSTKLGIKNDEPRHWKQVSDHIYIPEPNADGVIEQFRGFFDLKRAEIPEHEKHRSPISRLFKWEEINELQLSKQADVLMIPFLFPDALPLHVIEANYRYYEPITDHASSLSSCVHSAIAARIGLKEQALKYWKRSLQLDLLNAMANTELGIHAAALGGTWQALVFHILQIQFEQKSHESTFNALGALPNDWLSVELRLIYREKSYTIAVARDRRAVA